ncbi:MAG: cysteine desulfurase [Candidatus Altiarchaeota archaeon]|nr:cysteine desulfurase [Candidatus Altiarchaeota archaeon]
MKVYLDHGATTPVAKQVLDAMTPYFDKKFGNPASLHIWGTEAVDAVEKSRKLIAKRIGAKQNEVVFTSGGTESNNWALKGVAFANQNNGRHIITQKTEHDCVLKASKWLETQGFELSYLGVDNHGLVDPAELEATIREDTILVSIMQGNNEIGTVQPMRELGRICKEHGALFHSDACQSFTKEPLDLNKDKLDLITINAHKIYGPKGVGALVVKNGTKLTPLFHGGQQDPGRSGTINVSGIVGFGKSVEIADNKKNKLMKNLRNYLIDRIMDEVPNSFLNGHPEKRLINNANFSFKGLEGEALVLRLSARGIASSTGSACSSKKLEPSHVLMAIGRPAELAHGSLRLTVGWENKLAEIEYAIDMIKKEAKWLRDIGGCDDV